MKKIVKSIFMAALSMMVCTSCESYFDSVPSNVVSLDAVFSNRGLALQWLSNTYSYLPDETSQNYTGGDDETKGFGHLLAWKQSYHGINVILIILI